MSIQSGNIKIAEQLKLLSNLMLLDNASIWKIKPIQKASEIMLNLDIPAKQIEDFAVFDGIGESTSQIISQIIETGSAKKLQDLKMKYPKAEQAFGLMVVSGIGIKKAIGLYEQGITNLEALTKACDSGLISNQQIIRGVKLANNSNGRQPLANVYLIAYQVLQAIRNSPEVLIAEFAGSTRRGSETIKDIDLVVVSANKSKTTDLFLSFGEELIRGEEKVRIMLPIDNGMIQMDLLFTSVENYGAAILYFTGSKENNIVMRKHALARGLTLNEHGLFHLDGRKIVSETEEAIFKELGLPWIEPPLRNGLFKEYKLFDSSKITGDYHTHSNYSSDARDSIDAMVAKAKELGLKEIGITDHTETNYSFDPALIEQRRIECEDAENMHGIKVYASCETGINKDGSLDWEDSLLNKMDYVIASIHRSHYFETVKRLIKAAQHPKVKIIGHPTGRLLGKRDIPEDDWKELFKVCSNQGVLLEINGARMDLPTYLIKEAKSYGCKFIINSDAHSVEQFPWKNLAISLATQAELTDKDLDTI